MKILTVIYPEAGRNASVVKYAKIIRNDMIEEVETAFEEIDLHVEPETVEEIAYKLEHGHDYWYNETLCFAVTNDVLEF